MVSEMLEHDEERDGLLTLVEYEQAVADGVVAPYSGKGTAKAQYAKGFMFRAQITFPSYFFF